MSHEQKLRELFERLKENPEEIDSHIEFAKNRGAAFSFSQAAADACEASATPLLSPDAPPLWAERKPGWNDATGQKASPALWIKMHYGNKAPDNWAPMGLTSAELRQSDRALYQAYASWISRKPNDRLDLTKLIPISFDDPAKHLEHKREVQRLAAARYRAKNQL